MNPNDSCTPGQPPRARWATAAALALSITALPDTGTADPLPGAAPLASLPSVTVSSYLGTWYQVALFPNSFQRQCVSDTTATYRQRDDGSLDVLNRCRGADGKFDEALGRARPVGQVVQDELRPAQLQVSFLPGWLQWLPVGRGDYWVIQRADDGRYAVVSEPSRRYLWVLSRTPALAAADESAIRSRLQSQGFDLARWTAHPQRPAEPASAPRS
jgi:apolipoprotein D and lipocalin family protein